MGEAREITFGSADIGQVAKEVRGLNKHIHPQVPNPAPLGLFAFGLTTALLQMYHTEIGGDSKEEREGTKLVVLGFAVFFGGFLQVVAGLSEIRRNNIFGYTAFLMYGGFWMSVGTTYIVDFLAADDTVPNEKTLQAMLFLVGLYTTVLLVCTLKMNKTITLLFLLLATTCYLLAGGVRNETVDKIGGWFGLATSLVAYWLASVELINDVIGGGKEVIPLGHWNWNRFPSLGGAHTPGRTNGVTSPDSKPESNQVQPIIDAKKMDV